MLATLSLILVVGLLVAVATRGGGPPSGTAAAPSSGAARAVASGYPAPGSPAPPPTQPAYPGPHPTPYPTIVAHPMPTPVPVTQPYPPPGMTAPPTLTPYRLAPTPTWGPLPTVLPTVIPANLPRPTGYPTAVPRLGDLIISESGGWSLDQQVAATTYIVRAKVARIDPPFWSTLNGQRPAVVGSHDVTSPALLTVEEVYKGPSMQNLEVGIEGYCFTPSECTGYPYEYTWSDLAGYDLVLFIIAQPQVPGRPVVPTHAYPFRTYVINPDPTKDEAMFIAPGGVNYLPLSQLVSEIQAAPTANH
jgi:hypothetical protein